MKKLVALMMLVAFACCSTAVAGSIEDKPKTCEKCKECKGDGCKCGCHKKDDKK